MAFEGRLVVSSGRIHCALCFLCSVVPYRWQVAAQTVWSGACIPQNKACYRSLKLDLVDQIRLGVVLLPVAVALSWGEPKATMVKIIVGSINKVQVRVLGDSALSARGVRSLPLGRYGGGLRRWSDVDGGEADKPQGIRGAVSWWRSSSVARVWLPTQEAVGQLLLILM
jgi:hypothetical protein